MPTSGAAKIQHTIIVGGGLAGPCLALSLARHNIRSTILEIRPTRSTSGGSISLGPNAVHVLDRYANVYDRIKAGGFTYRRFGAFTEDGEKLGDIAVTDEKQGEAAYPAIRIMRSAVHDALIDATEASGGLVQVKWGAKLSQIIENEDGVIVSLDDGTSVQGDILVGADGIHSKVREYVLGPDAPVPVFTGLCIVNGFLPASAAPTSSSGFTIPAFMFTPSGMFMTVAIDPKGENLAWGINRPVEERTREQWQELERSGEAARIAKAEFAHIQTEPVRSLLDKADETMARVWAPYSIPDLPKWHTSRVCLIGDAAHALPPNGQGSAVAFEDAAILTRLLLARGDRSYERLFARFEAVRRPRVELLKKEGAKAPFRSKSGPWGWWLKKYMFRAFFWWNGGVLQYKLDAKYTVDEVDLDF